MTTDVSSSLQRQVPPDRFAGAMLGFALGDCLGAPALPDRGEQQQVIGRIEGPVAAPDCHPRWPGLPTGSATWLGRQAQQGLHDLAAGRPWAGWEELPPLPGAGLLIPGLESGSNTAVASAWPAALWGLHGLLHPGEPRLAAEAALAAWQGPPLTTSARTGLAMFAGALAAAVDGEDMEGILAGAQRGSRAGLDGPRLGTAPSLPYRLQQTAAPLSAATEMEMQLQQLYDSPGASELAAEAVPTALALVRAVGADPVWAALYAANLGGEATLIGAMAGAVAGAASGAQRVPAAWRGVADEAWRSFAWEHVATELSHLASRISE